MAPPPEPAAPPEPAPEPTASTEPETAAMPILEPPRPAPPSPGPPPEPASDGPPRRGWLIAGLGAALLVLIAAGLLIGGVFSSGSNAASTHAAVHTGTSTTTTTRHTTTTTQTSTTSPVTSTTTPSTSTATTTPNPSNATFVGRAFTIQYPTGWNISTDQKHYPWGTDTTIVSPADPQTVLRVDVSPHLHTSDPLTASQAEINQVAQQPGYKQLNLSPNTVNGLPGEHWEFLVNESGVLLHKVDEFVIGANNEGLAILTQAPAGQYRSLAKMFTSLRGTIAVR